MSSTANPANRTPRMLTRLSPALLSSAASCCLVCCLVACSGNGMGLDAGGQPLGGAGQGAGAVPLSADFASIQANVFTPICSVCHSGATAPKGLMLDAQHSYGLLVNVPSTEVPSLLRVDPTNPAASYLVQKLEGHAAVGQQMPLAEPPLPATTIAFIVQWITDGAQPAAAQSAMAAFAVAATSPADATTPIESPARIAVLFTRELDATHVDASSARLELLPDATPTSTSTDSALADVALAIPAAVSVPTGNSRTLLLTPRQPLQPGRYRLVLSADPAHELAALDGSRLATLAGVPAGDRVISRFAVEAGR